jgi:anti-sigma factor RsiW
MTCPELLQAIDPYLDDELSVLEVLRVQAHLLRCDPCRTAMESEASVHALLEADALQDRPCPALRERILQRLATVSPGQPSPERRRLRVAARHVVLGSAMLIVTFLAGALIVRFPGGSNVPPLIEEVVAKHRLYAGAADPPLDVKTTDAGQLTSSLTNRVGFPVKAPPELRSEERLIGGRVSSLVDAPAAYVLYERGHRPLSVFIARRPAPGLPEENKWVVDGVELYTSRIRGLTLVWWEDGDLVYAAASVADSLTIRSGGGNAPDSFWHGELNRSAHRVARSSRLAMNSAGNAQRRINPSRDSPRHGPAHRNTLPIGSSPRSQPSRASASRSPSSSPTSKARREGAFTRAPWLPRQGESERRALAHLARDPDASAVELDELLRQREPQAGPLLLLRTAAHLTELLEDRRLVGGSDPDPRVVYRDLHHLCTARRSLGRPGHQRDAPPLRRELHRVG